MERERKREGEREEKRLKLQVLETAGLVSTFSWVFGDDKSFLRKKTLFY
jgi:hypothetical protein